MNLYSRNGKKYLRVTTFLDMLYPFTEEAREAWHRSLRKQGYDPGWVENETVFIGLLAHDTIDCIFRKTPYMTLRPITEHHEKYVRMAEQFCEEYPICQTEVEVFNDTLHLAGRFDGLFDRGQLHLYDVKTWGGYKQKLDMESPTTLEKLLKVRQQISLYGYMYTIENGMLPTDLQYHAIVMKPDGTYEDIPLTYDQSIIEKALSMQDEILAKIVELENGKG